MSGLLLCIALATAAEIRVAPFLQDAHPDSVWVVWETDGGDDGVVRFGLTTPDQSATGEGEAGPAGAVVHSVQLTGLSPDTAYVYEVQTGDATSARHRFRTPPAVGAETSFRVVAMSDMQLDRSHPDKFREIVEDGVLAHVRDEFGGELADELAMALLPGDLVDNGWNYNEWADTFFGPGSALFSEVPVYPVYGNHEGSTPYFQRYFHMPDNGSGGLFSEHWWFADYANLRVIGLDSNSGFANQVQLDWLQGVLDDACTDPAFDFVFAQLHHPYLSELWLPGESNFTGDVIGQLEDFTERCGKPSVHFFGHTHGYSRGQSRDHQHLWVNVASAGGALDRWGEQPQADYDNFTVSQDEYGFVLMEVEGGSDPMFRLTRLGRGTPEDPNDNVVRDRIEVRLNGRKPETPQAWGPEDEVSADCSTLVAGAFAHADEAEHGASQWQLTGAGCDFDSPMVDRWVQHENWYAKVDRSAGVDLTRAEVGPLQAETDYCWRVRFRDRGLVWSDWSEPTPFKTTASEGATALLTNPGAEDGTAGWLVTDGLLEALSEGECTAPAPAEGGKLFSVGGLCDSTTFAAAEQAVDVSAWAEGIDAGGWRAGFGGMLADYGGDDVPTVALRFEDAAGEGLGQSEQLSSASSTWTSVRSVAPVPPGTRSIVVELTGTRNAGNDNDSYVDALELSLSPPEPEGCFTPKDPLPIEDEPDTDTPELNDFEDEPEQTPGCGCTSTSPAGVAGGVWLLLALARRRSPRRHRR